MCNTHVSIACSILKPRQRIFAAALVAGNIHQQYLLIVFIFDQIMALDFCQKYNYKYQIIAFHLAIKSITITIYTITVINVESINSEHIKLN